MVDMAIPDDVVIVEKNTGDGNIVLRVYNQLSVNETRILALGLEILRRKNDNSTQVQIIARDLVQIFGGNKGYYNELEKICQRLCKKQIVIDGKLYPIFSYLRFVAKNGGLIMQFNPPMLSMLLPEYRERAAQEVFTLNSMYAIKILELLNRYREKGRKRIRLLISIDDLRKYLGVPDTSTYQQMTNLKNKVLNHPITDINAKGHYHINYQVIKNGRKVTAFLFTMVLPDEEVEESDDGQKTI